MKSRVNREVHARFCEGLGVKFPGATRPLRIAAADRMHRRESLTPAVLMTCGSWMHWLIPQCDNVGDAVCSKAVLGNDSSVAHVAGADGQKHSTSGERGRVAGGRYRFTGCSG